MNCHRINNRLICSSNSYNTLISVNANVGISSGRSCLIRNILEIEGLTVDFLSDKGFVNVISDLSLTVARREVLGIVGESGSGKSVTSLAVMGLLPKGSARVRGRIGFEGRDLLSLKEQEMQRIRGDRIAMIFQEPMTSLNPIHSCGRQIVESIRLHSDLSKKEAEDRARELLELSGIADAGRRMREYPHQLSGGMRQRVMIAIALACDPDLLIADEPTTALDVTIQAQILELIKEIGRQGDRGIIFITHDLGVVSETCDRVVVMYWGEIVEMAPTRALFHKPLHPYTRGLIGAIPRLSQKLERLEVIEGMVPDAGEEITGCRFSSRCRFALPVCHRERPPLRTLPEGRQIRCFLVDKELGRYE